MSDATDRDAATSPEGERWYHTHREAAFALDAALRDYVSASNDCEAALGALAASAGRVLAEAFRPSTDALNAVASVVGGMTYLVAWVARRARLTGEALVAAERGVNAQLDASSVPPLALTQALLDAARASHAREPEA